MSGDEIRLEDLDLEEEDVCDSCKSILEVDVKPVHCRDAGCKFSGPNEVRIVESE